MVLQTRFSASLACCVLACTLTPHFANAFSLSTVPAARSLGISSTSLSSPAYRLNTPALGLRKYRSFSRITPTAVAEISTPLADAIQLLADASTSFTPSYSQNSYYATLGLFIISFPGAWSLIKRSVQYKPIKKIYVTEGPAKGKEVRQTAAEITAYFRALNFTPEPSKETVIFRGTMGRSVSQALYLTFCTLGGLAALGIVLTVTNPLVPDPKDFSPWYYMTLVSPLAGIYYWVNAAKEITVQVKMEESEDGNECDISALGTKEELERFCETLQFNEKGMVRVPGIMETLSDVV